MEVLSVKTAFELHSSIHRQGCTESMVACGTKTICVGSAVMADTTESCATALLGRSTARLCTMSPRHDNHYFIAIMDKRTFCAAIPASLLSSINYNHSSSKATQPLKRQSNPKIFKLHWVADNLYKNKPATLPDNEWPENHQYD